MKSNTTDQNASIGVIRWILENVSLRECTTVKFSYDHMDFQSNEDIHIIFQPFDATKKYNRE